MNNPLTPGDIIGDRYRIVQLLGQGGFGRTYLAEDMNCFQEHCVLKEFVPQQRDPDALEKAKELFEREAKTLHQLEHPQIPKFEGRFSTEIQGETSLFLVQDYIEGESYQDLWKKRRQQGSRFDEEEITQFLRNILPVLEYIHGEGIIHRDISPDNIILRESDKLPVLIDFGSIKQVLAAAQSQLATGATLTRTTQIGKPGYMPPEIWQGEDVGPDTDLYTLAVTVVVLATLEPPELINPNTSKSHWQDKVTLSNELALVLNKMLSPRRGDRYQSATQVLEALKALDSQAAPTVPNPINPNPSPPVPATQPGGTSSPKPASKFILLGLVVIMAGLLGGLAWFRFRPSIENKLTLSQGEEILIEKTPIKESAATAFGSGNYKEAVTDFKESLETKRNDPEALIYLNNSRIGNGESYTIVAIVPITSIKVDLNVTKEILRGIAQAQNEINSAGGINGIPLKVLIVDDDNKPEMAKPVAEALSKNKEVLGVVGHFSSDISLPAAEIYQQKELVMISPTSTAVKLTKQGNYIFRTPPSDLLAGATLARYALRELKLHKAAVFFNGESDYSKSLKKAFSEDLYIEGGEVVFESDLVAPNFNAADAVKQAMEQGAEVLMLASNTPTLNQSLQVMQVNKNELPLLGGDSLYKPETLRIGGSDSLGMVLAVPWHILGNPEAEFPQAARKLWGGEVNWRSAMAYDATMALIAALEENPSRSGVQEALSSPDFSPQGAARRIRFTEDGDRNQPIQLVKIVSAEPGGDFSYKFVPIE